MQQVNVRIPVSLRDKLFYSAKANSRSLSNEIIGILRNSLIEGNHSPSHATVKTNEDYYSINQTDERITNFA